VVRIQKFRIRIQKSRIRIVILVYQNPGSPLKPNRLFPGPCPPLQKFRQKSYTKFLDQDNDPDSGTLDPCRDPGHYKNLIEVGPSATQIPPESFSNQYVLILFWENLADKQINGQTDANKKTQPLSFGGVINTRLIVMGVSTGGGGRRERIPLDFGEGGRPYKCPPTFGPKISHKTTH